MNEDVARATARAVDEVGGLNILANNAGIVVRGPIDEISRAGFERSMPLSWLRFGGDEMTDGSSQQPI